MRILVVGATGRTGRHVVNDALLRGHQVTAVVRDAKDFAASPDLQVVVADPCDAGDLRSILVDHEVVISCLGQRSHGDRHILEKSAGAMHAATRQCARKRYIVISQGLHFPSRNPLIFILKLLLASHVADSAAMEAKVRESDLDWTIVRPPRLVDGGRARGYATSVGTRPAGPASMQRIDLAAFLLDEAQTPNHLRQIVGITAAA